MPSPKVGSQGSPFSQAAVRQGAEPRGATLSRSASSPPPSGGASSSASARGEGGTSAAPHSGSPAAASPGVIPVPADLSPIRTRVATPAPQAERTASAQQPPAATLAAPAQQPPAAGVGQPAPIVMGAPTAPADPNAVRMKIFQATDQARNKLGEIATSAPIDKAGKQQVWKRRMLAATGKALTGGALPLLQNITAGSISWLQPKFSIKNDMPHVEAHFAPKGGAPIWKKEGWKRDPAEQAKGAKGLWGFMKPAKTVGSAAALAVGLPLMGVTFGTPAILGAVVCFASGAAKTKGREQALADRHQAKKELKALGDAIRSELYHTVTVDRGNGKQSVDKKMINPALVTDPTVVPRLRQLIGEVRANDRLGSALKDRHLARLEKYVDRIDVAQKQFAATKQVETSHPFDHV